MVYSPVGEFCIYEELIVEFRGGIMSVSGWLALCGSVQLTWPQSKCERCLCHSMTIAFPGSCCGEWACLSHLIWGIWTQKQGCDRHIPSFWFSTNRPLWFSTNCQILAFLWCVWDCCSQRDGTLFENQSPWIAHSNLPGTPFWAICMEGEKMFLLINPLLSSSVKPPGRKTK